MKAALKAEDGRFTIEEVDKPDLPGGDWVRARVRVAGICGTDLRHWKKHEPEIACHIVGHELAGEVEAVRAFTGGRGVDVAFECAGGESTPQTPP